MSHSVRIAAFALTAFAAWAQQPPSTAKRETVQGTLIDAGCSDRSLWNMTRPPEAPAAAMPAPPSPQAKQGTKGAQATQSEGVTLDSKTAGTERQDITPVMNPEAPSRQSDPTCAIKANTRAFAVLLGNGRLLDLDEGGNTFAALAVQHSPQGRALINGRGPGFKPRVSVVGVIEGDRLFTDDVKLR
jgi:hypothetical protein